MASCTITESRTDHTAILVCAGRLDNNASGLLEQHLAPLLAEGVKHVVLDLAGVDYLSSAGVRGILVALKKTSLAGGSLSLCGVTASVLDVLRLSGFHTIVKIFPDRSAALAAA